MKASAHHTAAVCTKKTRVVLSEVNRASPDGAFPAAMYLARRWRPPDIAAQPRNLLEKYPGALRSCAACSMNTVKSAQHESALFVASALTRTLSCFAADTVCPEQKVIHTTCPPCECRIKDKVRRQTAAQSCNRIQVLQRHINVQPMPREQGAQCTWTAVLAVCYWRDCCRGGRRAPRCRRCSSGTRDSTAGSACFHTMDSNVQCTCMLAPTLQRKLEADLGQAVQQRDVYERSLMGQRDELASLRAAAKQRDSTFRIANPEVRLHTL
jgi:hypothetical protein